MAFKVMVVMLFDAEQDSEAFDAVNEMLREKQRSFSPESLFMDYVIESTEPWEGDTVNYNEGDAFGTYEAF
jgi:hypothetical protein